MLLTIVIFLLTISFLIFIHEGGHFLVAKWARVWVYQFAIGVGPAIARWRGRETEYSLRLFPIGGFVRMAGDEEPAAGHKRAPANGQSAVSDAAVPPERLFTAKSPLQRMAIVFAGPLMNILGAVLIIILLVGLVGVPYVQIAGFSENSPAAAVMQLGDVILAVDGQEIYSSQQVSRLVQGSGGRALTMLVARAGEGTPVTVKPYWDDAQSRYLIGVSFYGALLNQIGQLSADSPLAKLGLHENDAIVRVNGQSVHDWFGFTEGLRQALVAGASKLTLQVLRDGQQLDQTWDLSAGPSDLNGWLKGARSSIFPVYPSTNIVQEIDAHAYLGQQGLQKGDRLLSANGVPIYGLIDLVNVFSRAGQGDGRIALQIARSGGTHTLQFQIDAHGPQSAVATLQGMQLQAALRRPSGLLNSLVIGTRQTWDILVSFYLGLRSIVLGEVPAKEALSGPVGIADILGRTVHQGVGPLFLLIALLSLNLGIINLLPFPALDGSRIAFILYELIRGKPISPQKEGWVHTIGFFVLIGALLLITYNDILRLLGRP